MDFGYFVKVPWPSVTGVEKMATCHMRYIIYRKVHEENTLHVTWNVSDFRTKTGSCYIKT